MYPQSRGKGSAHTWLSDNTNIGAISYLIVQTYKYEYHCKLICNFQTVHHRNAALHVGTYALLVGLLPSDQFLCTLAVTPTLSQDRQMLTLDDKHYQIFNELQGKFQDILMAVKAIVAICRKGQGGS